MTSKTREENKPVRRKLDEPERNLGGGKQLHTVLVVGCGELSDCLRARLETERLHWLTVPELNYLPCAVSLYEPLAVVGCQPAVDNLSELMKAVVWSGMYVPLIVSAERSTVRLLLGHSLGSVDHPRAAVVIAAAILSVKRQVSFQRATAA